SVLRVRLCVVTGFTTQSTSLAAHLLTVPIASSVRPPAKCTWRASGPRMCWPHTCTSISAVSRRWPSILSTSAVSMGPHDDAARAPRLKPVHVARATAGRWYGHAGSAYRRGRAGGAARDLWRVRARLAGRGAFPDFLPHGLVQYRCSTL